MTMKNFKFGGALCCALAVFSLAAPAYAESSQTIELRTNDGTALLRGDFLGIENGEYVIDTTTLGEYRVDVSRVSCTGAACPELSQAHTPRVIPASLLAGRP